jgi:hypothetical protein
MKPLKDRFEKLFDKKSDDECWLWKGYKDKNGYGQFCNIVDGKVINYRAPRLSFTLYKGPIPNGKVIMHSCDCPECVNPAHLSIGTMKDNMDDKMKKGRYNNGRPRRTTNAKQMD